MLKANIFTLAPASGAHFFRRPSHGVGHKHPLKATTDANSPIGLPRQFLLWPATSPATFTPGKSGSTTPVCPSILSQDAQNLFHQGLPFLLTRACVDDPTLPPAAWLAAYGALTTSNFQQAHLNALTASSILEEFTEEIVNPILNNEDRDNIRIYVESILNSTHVSWTTVHPHRPPPPTDTPPEDELVDVLVRKQYSSLKHWVDDLQQKFDHLLHILANATDLARSPNGWVFLHSLKRYSGHGVPGNWDAHTNTTVHTNTFSLFSSGQPLPLDRHLLCSMVAFDDNRRRYRFTLGEAPDSNGKPSLVIAASSCLPTAVFDASRPSSGRRTAPSSILSRTTLPKYGVYFCQSKIFHNILLRDGIKPTQRNPNISADNIALKLHATNSGDISEGVINSRLNRSNHPICLFINIPATFDAGFTWTSLMDSVIGTPKVPLPPTFFHRAIDISGITPVERWLSPLPSAPANPRHDLPVSAPATTDLAESRINAQADARVQHIFDGPVRPTPPTEEPDLPDAEDDEPDQYDPGMDTAFAHLLQVIDQPAGTAAPALTPELYAALSVLSHTRPWSSLTFDLKALLPELDRRFHTYLIAGLCHPEGPAVLTTGLIFNSLLYTMAATITGILAPPNSDIPLPDVDPAFFTQDFWHAHLVYASDLASPQGLQASAIDTLAGDQLCQWSAQGVNIHSLLSASHLTVFLPPRVGAYLLANHGSHASLLTTPHQDRSHFVVRQNALFHAPQLMVNTPDALNAARDVAARGGLVTSIIPHLADPDPAAIQRRLTWTLRFPLPAAAPSTGGGQRFADLALHSTGHRSTSALHNAIRRGTAAHPLGVPFPACPAFLRLPDPSHGTGRIRRPGLPVQPEASVVQWLKAGAPRVTFRQFPDPATRPPIPEALLAFFDGNISHAHIIHLLDNHQCDDQQAPPGMPASASGPQTAPAAPPINPALADFLARRPPSLPKSVASRSRTPPGTTPASTPRTLEGPPVPAPHSKGKGKGKGKQSYRDAAAQPPKGKGKGKGKGKPVIGKGPIGK